MEQLPYTAGASGAIDPSQCNGCAVCLLSCPVWRQHHTKALTYCGRNRAAIGGAAKEDLAPSAQACILCGSCEAVCPMGIATQQATLLLRRSLAAEGRLPAPALKPVARTSGPFSSRRLLVPGKALRSEPRLLAQVSELLGRPGLAPDDGEELCLALESGSSITRKELDEFTRPLRQCAEVIVSDGLMVNLLGSLLPPSVAVRPLGQVLLAKDKVRKGIRKTDLYMIETRAYNARRRDLAAFYDSLRHDRGCAMNLDLLRVATPTGAASWQHRQGLDHVVSVKAQVGWLLEGRAAERIVVEHLDDRRAFAAHTSLPVIHLAEAAQP